MTCRTCYAQTLSRDELDRFNAEPITSCIHLCEEHQEQMDRMLRALPIPMIERDKR